MKIKENIHIIVFASVGFLILYTFLAPRSLSTELQLTPQWTTSIFQENQGTGNTSATQIPFQLGQNMGYFTQDGQITMMESYPFHATISPEYRATYAPDSTRIPVYQVSTPVEAGQPDFYLEGAGFPFFADDRLYLFGPGGYGVSQYSKEEGKLWQFEHAAPIVTFSSSEAGAAIGYADGTVFIFSSTGELMQTFEPGGSTYPIILGTALSPSGNQLACVSGIDQQRFVLTQQRNGVNKVVFHTYLEKNQREPVLVQFSKDESMVFYASGTGIGIVDCTLLETKELPLKGNILAIEECNENGLICVLTKDSGRYNIYLIETNGTLIGSFGFKAAAAFINVTDGDLYVGRDTKISKIDLTRK